MSAPSVAPAPRRFSTASRARYELRTYVTHRIAVEALATLARDYRKINDAHAAALAGGR